MSGSKFIIRGTRPDEAEEVMQLWKAVFPQSSDLILRSFLETDPWRDTRYGRVCECDGKLVSISYIGCRPIMTRNGIRKTGGIGYVGTLPEYRGRGINTRVMLDCIRVMEEDGIALSFLITPINPYYERMGYQTVPRPSLIITPGWDGWQKEFQVADFSDTCPSIPDLLSVYAEFNRNRPVAVVRDEAYWDGWVSVRHRNARWFTVREEGELTAYAQVRIQEEAVRVPEFGWLPGKPESADLIARALVALALHEKKPVISMSAPIEPVLNDAFKATGAHTHIDHAHNTMFRNINMDKDEYQAVVKEITDGTGVLWGADCT